MQVGFNLFLNLKFQIFLSFKFDFSPGCKDIRGDVNTKPLTSCAQTVPFHLKIPLFKKHLLL